LFVRDGTSEPCVTEGCVDGNGLVETSESSGGFVLVQRDEPFERENFRIARRKASALGQRLAGSRAMFKAEIQFGEAGFGGLARSDPAGMPAVTAASSAWVRAASAWPTRASSSPMVSWPCTNAALTVSITRSRSACDARR
jgi:hypothetical protein